jgi:hypothetical protein
MGVGKIPQYHFYGISHRVRSGRFSFSEYIRKKFFLQFVNKIAVFLYCKLQSVPQGAKY